MTFAGAVCSKNSYPNTQRIPKGEIKYILRTYLIVSFCRYTFFTEDWVAEWLRRWTANPMGSARVGSNPIFVVILFVLPGSMSTAHLFKKQNVPLPGIEPGPPG